MPALLVIDDEEPILDCFRFLFPRAEVSVDTALSGAEGVERFARSRPDAVVLDIRLPDLSGLDVFRRLHEIDARVPVIVVTGHGTAETAIEAMRLGAYDYVVKPLDAGRLGELILRAFAIGRLMRVPARVAGPGTADPAADVLVGSCPPMQEVYKAIGRVAPQNVTVLVTGESGTGKELVARAVYHYSGRSAGPFLAINCAAIPEALLESELFGHEKGAFTGAERKRIGKFEQCHGGTLFLDEVGDMTPLTQTKVLRVLQDGQFERVGGNETIRADVRIIAATNRDLGRLIEEGRFREDLYYRLNGYAIPLPPLRQRAEDLPLLVEHFLRRFSRELGKDVRESSPEAQELLRGYAWPGNVRELQGVLRQAIVRATGPVLVPEFLPAPLHDGAQRGPAAAERPDLEGIAAFVEGRLAAGSTDVHAEVLALVERRVFLQVLRHTENNQSRAARALGITRSTLRARLEALGIAIERAAVEERPPGP